MEMKKSLLAVSFAALMSNYPVFATTAEGEEAYNQQRYDKAYMLLSEEAAKGDAKAQYLLGSMYYHAQGVPYSAEKTEQWLLASANQGNVDAQVLLADFYWYQKHPKVIPKP